MEQVDLSKVNISVIKPWISQRVTELVGFEDKVLADFAMRVLETEPYPVRPQLSPKSTFIDLDQTPDPRRMQKELTGFFCENAPVFMAAFWRFFA